MEKLAYEKSEKRLKMGAIKHWTFFSMRKKKKRQRDEFASSHHRLTMKKRYRGGLNLGYVSSTFKSFAGCRALEALKKTHLACMESNIKADFAVRRQNAKMLSRIVHQWNDWAEMRSKMRRFLDAKVKTKTVNSTSQAMPLIRKIGH